MDVFARLLGEDGVSKSNACVFGSEDALDTWIGQFTVGELDTVGWSALDIHETSSNGYWQMCMNNFVASIDDVSSTRVDFIYLDCTAVRRAVLASSPGESYNLRTSSQLENTWALLKYQQLFREDANKLIFSSISYESMDTLKDPGIESGISSVSTTPSISEQLLLNPPIFSSPSTICMECANTIVSAKAFLSPPGYCEYTGKFICGGCFEPRAHVVPWRLIAGSETIRGRVSRASAKFIQELLYSPVIHYSDIVVLQRGHLEVSERMNAAHALRMELMMLRPVLHSCSNAAVMAESLIASLPAHMRNESLPEEALLYSLADLWDILHPPGVCSIITRALRQLVALITNHSNCTVCDSLFNRNCEFCEMHVSTVSLEWTFCELCASSFHRSCLRFSTDGCPVCSSLRELERPLINSLNFIQLDFILDTS